MPSSSTHQSDASASSTPEPTRRARKHAQLFPAPPLAAAKALVEHAGQQELVARMAETAKRLEASGDRCSSLAELAGFEPQSTPCESRTGDEQQAPVDLLREFAKLTAALAAWVGAGACDPQLRSSCFEFSRACQIAAAQLRKSQI